MKKILLPLALAFACVATQAATPEKLLDLRHRAFPDKTLMQICGPLDTLTPILRIKPAIELTADESIMMKLHLSNVCNAQLREAHSAGLISKRHYYERVVFF